MSKLISRISLPQKILTIILGLSIVPLYMQLGTIDKNVILKNFKNGVSVCFFRINQSFLAYTLGNAKSENLTQNFKNNSEECWAEVNQTLDENLFNDRNELFDKLNTISSMVYKFHKSINTLNEEKGLSSKQILSFQNIESLYQDILKEAKNLESKNLLDIKNGTLLFLTIIAFILIWPIKKVSLFSMNKKEREELEEEAKAELKRKDRDLFSSKIVESIIQRALGQSQLNNVQKLFENYHQDIVNGELGKVLRKNSSENLDLTVPKISSPKPALKKNSFQELTQEKKSPKKEMIKSCDLEDIIGKVLKVNSKNIIKHGIITHLEIPKKLIIVGDKESVFQGIHLLISHSIRNIKQNIFERKLCILVDQNEKEADLSIMDSGEGFSKELIGKKFNSMKNSKLLPENLRISLDLLESSGNKVELRNYFSASDNKAHSHIKIKFNKAITTKNIRIVKGKKEDILSQMSV